MAMIDNANDVVVVDRQVYNQIPEVHVLSLQSSRSVLKFNDVEEMIKIEVYNDAIKCIFNYFLNIKFFHPKVSYTLMANDHNFSLIIVSSDEKLIKLRNDLNLRNHLNLMPQDYKLSYYQYNNEVIVDGKFIDWYGIKKDVQTFTQRDDNIRMNIIKILSKETSINCEILFIGGEMYTYAKVLQYTKAIAFTDFEGIRENTINNNNNILAYTVNYQTDNIISYINDAKINPTICIVNVLNGLTRNLINQIDTLDINKIMIISCKPLKELNFQKLKLNTKIYKLVTPHQEIQLSIWEN